MQRKPILFLSFLLGAVGLAALIAGCGGSGSGGEGTFTFVAYGGTTQQNVSNVFVKPFAEEKGITLLEENVDLAKLEAQEKNEDVTWDAVNLEPWISNRSCAEGNATPLDTNVVEVSKLPAEFHGKCWMAAWSYSFVLAYNTEKLEKAPTSWADFFDTKNFPGKRGLWSYPEGAQLEAALMAEGVPKNELYPLDVPRAIKKLESIKSEVVFSESLQEMVQQLASGETSMAIVLSGRVAQLIKQGKPLGIDWHDQVVGPDSYMIPKGAPDAKMSMELLNSMLDTGSLVKFAKVQFYGPATKEAQEELASDPDCELINTCGGKLADGVVFDTKYWEQHEQEVSETWDGYLGR